jgi:carbonic anhydrase/acetyltransferase-like protein (isoleucine patch superfamily)
MAIFELDGQRPELSETSWVAPQASLIGRVRLQAHSSVWFSAVLRGDNEWIDIGERSNVQDGAVLHTDIGFPLTVGEDCTIGHQAILHGCTIGDGTLIGMGAVILNGARMGAHCLVGAGALITEGKEFPDGSLIVGSPAKVVRQLDDLSIQKLKDSAGSYARNAARFRSGLREISE